MALLETIRKRVQNWTKPRPDPWDVPIKPPRPTPPTLIAGAPRRAIEPAGSVYSPCTDCGLVLTLYADSGAWVLARYPGTPVVCLACSERRSGPEKERWEW